MPVIIPLVGDKEAASVDELDDQLLLLEAARRRLDIEWAETLGEFERRCGHDVFGYPDVVAYLRHRVAGCRVEGAALRGGGEGGVTPSRTYAVPGGVGVVAGGSAHDGSGRVVVAGVTGRPGGVLGCRVAVGGGGG
jgi:hypothetical protein